MQWGALGRAIVSRRIECGYETREELAEHSGIAARTLGDLETGRKTSYRRSTLARLEQALDWPAGTVDEVLGEPAPSPRRTTAPPPSSGPPSAPAFEEQLATLRHLHDELPEPYREQFRDLLARAAEWAMYAQQMAAMDQEVAEVAGWDPGHEQVTPAPPGHQSVR